MEAFISSAAKSGVGLDQLVLPEWGLPKKGKVRDIYFKDENVIMITNDRVSAFDVVLPNLIPFKGEVLNYISEYMFKQTSDIVPNALVQPSIDPNIVVQKKMENLQIECIVRGYLWGSMAAAYEKGERAFCGLEIPDGLIRYQKLPSGPIFTPTTKAEVGHDENLTFAEVEEMVGKDLAAQVRDLSFKLFERGTQKMAERGLILIDTKYEFGLDPVTKQLHVIDEVNTPDSSRLCEVEEYEKKWPKVEAAYAAQDGEVGMKKPVSALLKQDASLKIKEFSKQYVRDTLLDMGFTGEEKDIFLSTEQVAECAQRYVQVCEKITGQKFFAGMDFTAPGGTGSSSSTTAQQLFLVDPRQRLLQNLVSKSLLSPALACVFAGSDSDKAHIEKLEKEFAAKSGGKIATQVRICSAHKQPKKLQEVLEYYNTSDQVIAIVACAGGTDALSGTASFLSRWPVVSCPPDGLDNKTCVINPPGSSNAFVPKVGNSVRFCLQLLAGKSAEVASALLSENGKKVKSLEAADARYSPGFYPELTSAGDADPATVIKNQVVDNEFFGGTSAASSTTAAASASEVEIVTSGAPAGEGADKESMYKKKILDSFLHRCEVDAVYLPEYGDAKKGKVRDIYFQDDKVLMITNDRVSAFDVILPNLIPFKGYVLNAISEYMMEQTADIIPNALVSSPDPHVMIQKRMENLKVECIVRGYLWGSMAAAYEKGERVFCGLEIPDGLIRYQKLPSGPIFTPTTKAEVGHDENLTFAEVEGMIGKDLAAKVRDISFKLFARGTEKMAERGLILIDTKYEFGLDPVTKELYVIDEVNTPDSSRLCGVEEYDKKFAQRFRNGEKPEKVKEFSKQYVRDCLLDMGFKPEDALKTENKIFLNEKQVVECAFRYITVYETIVGKEFPFGLFSSSASTSSSPSGGGGGARIVANLQKAKLLSPGVVLLMAGSDSDAPHLAKIEENCRKVGIQTVHTRICSAHKQPGKLQDTLEKYNTSAQMIVIIGCAGGTDALSGTASFHAKFPVVSCPPDGPVNHTCLTNPPGSSNAIIYSTSNVARFAMQVLGCYDESKVGLTLKPADAVVTPPTKTAASGKNTASFLPSSTKKLLEGNQEKIKKLVKADCDFVAKNAPPAMAMGA